MPSGRTRHSSAGSTRPPCICREDNIQGPTQASRLVSRRKRSISDFAISFVRRASELFSSPRQMSRCTVFSLGRVQVYDSHWKFVRGWHVDAGGGTFILRVLQGGRVEVLTARGEWRYVFELSGNLLSKEHYLSAAYSSFPKEGQSRFVPTAPWLWVFSNPIYSWLSAAAGIGLLIASGKISLKKKGGTKKHS